MLTTDTTVELGRLHHGAIGEGWPKHVLLYLPVRATVIMPICRIATGWRCTIVATRTACRSGHMLLPREQLAAATSTVAVDAERDPDGYARLLWLPRVFATWPGGTILALARLIVDQLRPAGSLGIPAQRLANHTHIATRLPNTRPPAVERLIYGLASNGFLTSVDATSWHLTLPTR